MKSRILTDQDETEGSLLFWCPGCEEAHACRVQVQAAKAGDGRPTWGWNGSLSSPTLDPSVLTKFGEGFRNVCHLYLRNGQLQFLGDCTHQLAGQTVDLPDLPDDWAR